MLKNITIIDSEDKHALISNWWQVFNSPELDELVQISLANNFDMNIAAARLSQSKAILQQSVSGFFPAINAEGNISTQKNQIKLDNNSPNIQTYSDNYTLGGIASYELDLWGRVFSTYSAQKANFLATEADYFTAKMTISANVVSTYIELLGLKAEQKLVQEQITINSHLLKIQRIRFNNALGTGLDVLQQQEVLLERKAELPQITRQINNNILALQVLSGKLPSGDAVFHDNLLPDIPKLPDMPDLPVLGLPIELLENRPDLRAAWQRLNSADWNVSAAQAARLPSFNISVNASYNSPESSLLFSNWLTQLIGGFTAPIFDAGYRLAEVKRLQALVAENVQEYAKSVAIALQEVYNALNNEAKQGAQLDLLQQKFKISVMARNEAYNSYMNGRDDFLRYISQHQSTQILERQIVQAKTIYINYRIALYRALGGAVYELKADL